MNKTKLQEVLNREEFNPRVYGLDGGMPDERLVLSDERSQWCVYYSERGRRTDEKCFKTETEACEYFINLLRSLPISQTKFKSN
jgi:hypothetical protein